MRESQGDRRRFVVATPFRTVCDDNARALEKHGFLRLIALGTRKGTPGVARERTRLLPAFGLLTYAASRLLTPYYSESFRFLLHAWFDRWALRQLRPGDYVISSYGYANACFRWARQHGGVTFLDAGNSHPENFWTILTEEHRRWGCRYPPVARHHYRRSVAMLKDVDYVLSPSDFVTRSFLQRGFHQRQIIRNVYPVDLSLFTPGSDPRPPERPLTVISTGSLSLRKGTPYLLEAFRIVHERVPAARLQLTRIVADSVARTLATYSDLPIDWSPPLPHSGLVDRLRGADIFVLPSLEDGFARTVTEALACGLPAIVTPNTGAADLVRDNINGSIVPIRDSQALAAAILSWWTRLQQNPPIQSTTDLTALKVETFEQEFLRQLKDHGVLPNSMETI